jgi:hypothetical protein
MIKGDLYFRDTPPNQTDPVTLPISSASEDLPIWCAQPFVDVEIQIPKLSIKRTFTMLVDTGADWTVLNLRDAQAALGKSGYQFLKQASKTKNSIGVGGSARYYNVNADIFFEHHDNSLEGYSFELAIVKPSCMGFKRNMQLRIPSILGRDILCHFRLTMDYSRCELLLDH